MLRHGSGRAPAPAGTTRRRCPCSRLGHEAAQELAIGCGELLVSRNVDAPLTFDERHMLPTGDQILQQADLPPGAELSDEPFIGRGARSAARLSLEQRNRAFAERLIRLERLRRRVGAKGEQEVE